MLSPPLVSEVLPAYPFPMVAQAENLTSRRYVDLRRQGTATCFLG